jgi:hypothetical protein
VICKGSRLLFVKLIVCVSHVQENLAPALRVQTERRLTSLQADLAKAEHRTVERKNGERYHMVSPLLQPVSFLS